MSDQPPLLPSAPSNRSTNAEGSLEPPETSASLPRGPGKESPLVATWLGPEGRLAKEGAPLPWLEPPLEASPRPSPSRDASWRAQPMAQAIPWPDPSHLEQVLKRLSALPPLVFFDEIKALRGALAQAARGEAFVLQGGDCAEEFKRCTAPSIVDTLKTLLQMSTILCYATGKPVVRLGRLAGQYAKPRSSPFEVVDGVRMAAFRGDCVNRPEPTLEARQPDPERLIEAFHCAAATLNVVRAFTKGGGAAIDRIQAWNREFVARSPQGQAYGALASQLESALGFLRASGIDLGRLRELQQVDFYTSHEGLILELEEALTRQDPETGAWYDCSAHFVWIGDRTRQLEGAHVAYFRSIANPIGVKVGPSMKADELLKLIELLNPGNEPGRLMLISRFGYQHIVRHLPRLVRAVRRAGMQVVWSCDPMHGNTFKSDSGLKTRHFHHLMAELNAYFHIHLAEGTWPGGLHFELTGDDVTECLGGGQEIGDANLAERYLTACDPRLNAQQSLEMAFILAEALRTWLERSAARQRG